MPEYIVKSKLPPIELPNISVGEFFHREFNAIIAKDPAKVALIDGKSGKKLTYLQFSNQAKKIASSLLQNGVASSDLGIAFSENSFNYLILSLAMAYLGRPVVPNRPSNGAFETLGQLTICKATVLMVSFDRLPVILQIFKDGQNAEILEQLKLVVLMEADSVPEECSIFRKVVTYDQLDALNVAPIETIPHYAVANPARDPYTIVFTSGSTGMPKGAVLSHRCYISSILNSLQAKCFYAHKGEMVLFAAPVGHISGIYFFGVFLLCEFQLLVMGTMQPEPIYESCEKYRFSYALISFLHGVHMLANDKYDLSSIKTILTSGGKFYENIARGLIAKYGWEINEIWGATEFMGSVFNNDDWESGNLGSPLPNIELKVIDLETGQSLPANEVGEILVRGPGCFVGYLNNEKATKEAIDEEGWYHSGDVGYYNEKGCLFLTARLKELIKYKGYSIAPAEIEALIQSHPAVEGVCVVGVRHASESSHLRAYVQLRGGKTATAEEIKQLVKDNMGYPKWLNGGVVFIKAIPRVSIGKIDRKYFAELTKDELLTEPAPLE